MTACLRCGDPGVELHHPTGRTFDADLEAPLCPLCHRSEHRTWATLGLALPTTSTPFEAVEVRLRRLAVFFAGCADGGHPVYGPLARALERWADLLAEGMCRLDHALPAWRRVFGGER